MSVRDVDGLNVGYAQGLLEQYLENPEAVPEEWRALFESGDAGLVESLPGLARLLETLREENGAPPAVEAPSGAEPARGAAASSRRSARPAPRPRAGRPRADRLRRRGARRDAPRRGRGRDGPRQGLPDARASRRATSTRSAPSPSATRRSSRSASSRS